MASDADGNVVVCRRSIEIVQFGTRPMETNATRNGFLYIYDVFVCDDSDGHHTFLRDSYAKNNGSQSE